MITTNPQMEKLAPLIQVAEAGAKAIITLSTTPEGTASFRYKPDRSMFTEADRVADETVKSTILRHFPDILYVSEEDATMPTPKESRSKVAIVDPLDGTTNYTRQIPLYAISIALLTSGVLEAGVVLNIVSGDTYAATRGGGAWKRKDREWKLLRRVTGRPLREAILSLECDMGWKKSREKWRQWSALLMPPICYRFRVMECAALGLCWVAEGLVDGYLHPTDNPWDMAAGGLIAAEAGSTLFSSDGRDWGPLKRGIVALAPGLKDEVARILFDKKFKAIMSNPQTRTGEKQGAYAARSRKRG